MDKVVEQRKHKRQCLTTATVALASNFYAAGDCNIIDVSAGGLLSGNIPARLVLDRNVLNKETKLKAVIHQGNQFVKVLVIPRWFNSECRSYLRVGFEIVGNPANWFDFIRMNTEIHPKRQDDLWGIAGQKYLRC